MKKDEILNTIDKYGKVTGKAKRSELHKNPKLIHRSVHCLVFNPKGELYLQKRSLNKDIQPGKWDTSVGGHVDLDENINDAIKRETYEELNIKGVNFTHLYEYLWQTDVESELINTFKISYDKNISYDRFEISEGRFFNHKEISKLIKMELCTPNFKFELEKYNTFNKKRMAL